MTVIQIYSVHCSCGFFSLHFLYTRARIFLQWFYTFYSFREQDKSYSKKAGSNSDFNQLLAETEIKKIVIFHLLITAFPLKVLL